MDEFEPDTWVEARDVTESNADFIDILNQFGPVRAMVMFVLELSRDQPDVGVLEDLVTPESLAGWGDFSDAKRVFDAIPNSGYSDAAPRAPGAPDVAFPRIIDTDRAVGHTGNVTIHGERIAEGAYPFTVIWRPELGGWRVHSWNDEVFDLEALPRTSPGDAPA